MGQSQLTIQEVQLKIKKTTTVCFPLKGSSGRKEKRVKMFKNKIEKNYDIFHIVFLQHRVEIRGQVKKEPHETGQRGDG